MTVIKEIVTLSDYYEALPPVVAPKTNFVKRISERTGKQESTVRLWVKNKSKPDDPKDFEILSEETGLSIDKLFN
jgi:hypothetical protein